MKITKKLILGVILVLQFAIFLLFTYWIQTAKMTALFTIDPVWPLFISWTLLWIGIILVLERGG